MTLLQMIRRLPPDTTGFQAATALFAICLAINWATMPYDMMTDNPSFRTLAVLQIPQDWWAVGLCIYGMFGIACAWIGSTAKKAAWHSVSICLWLYLGIQLSYASMTSSSPSIVGMFGLALAAGNFTSLMQLIKD